VSTSQNHTGRSFISNLSGAWIEHLHALSRNSPERISEDWNQFFAGFDLANSLSVVKSVKVADDVSSLKVPSVLTLVEQYRSIGHLSACTDPLSPCMLSHPLLELAHFDLDESDLDVSFVVRTFSQRPVTLREIVTSMSATYCREIGVEFMHIQDPSERQWLIQRMEPSHNLPDVNLEEKLHLLEKLHQAALFESFLQRRFPAQKRFSLEGGDTLIPALDAIVRYCPEMGISSVVLGMAHRGRLNVLAHVLEKPYENIFAEFRDEMAVGFAGDGDVKYHKGYSSEIGLPDGHVHVTIASNPSHLEAVNPVVEGKCRARQDRFDNGGGLRVLPLLIHGDGAFSGQGSIMETLNLSRLEGYSTGGTIHIVLNNQIGFTTRPRDARSTLYATDSAKMLSCPVFHVQGESPEAVLHCVRLAMDYRRTFGRDVVIELVCYRRYGHNEADEPAFTQPLMYGQIRTRPAVNVIYANTLAESGVSRHLLDGIQQSVIKRLESSFDKLPQVLSVGYKDTWSSLHSGYVSEHVDTGVSPETLLLLSRRLAELPPGFTCHEKMHAMLQKRFEAVLKGAGIDWGNAEALAYASLLNEGVPVRLSGQDTCRGTFSHRHCVLHDITNDDTCMPLSAVARDGAVFQVWDSPLSEFGVLGFEYGYSLESPHGLTIWEAQFGDFANGAQVVIDQFIASGETKWNRASGLVLLLPHGYEGQGAEHSSARIERFLQLCAGNNMVVANPTSPAQMFHILRRQVKRSFRKPLILFTPKSLLRHPGCVSSVPEICNGPFLEVIAGPVLHSAVKRVLICSGKIYYDLREAQIKRGDADVMILRVEQLYPLPTALILQELSRIPDGFDCIWVQEEPENMGAWPFVSSVLTPLCGSIRFMGRPADSCPAVGSHRLHLEQQAGIVRAAFES
jgi:2-oxoglutarate dehydrogenase E1 component